MAVLPRGTPVRYTDNSSNVYPGLLYSDNGVNSEVAYYNGSAWTVTSAIARDDSGATINTYAVVGITAKFEGT